jgi:chromosome segregation ATPase
LLQGVDAFRPNDFGKTILIQRTLFRLGSCVSKVSVRNATTHAEVDSRMSMVNEICDAFNIQIENPCAILMQETAKQFLTASSSAVKYRFFTDATRIAAAEKDYAATHDEISAMQATLVRLEDMLQDMRDKRDALERESQAAAHLRDLANRIAQYEGELMVSQLNDSIASVEEMRRFIAAIQLKRDQLVRERDDAERLAVEANARRQECSAGIDALKQQTMQVTDEIKGITARVQLERNTLFDAESNAANARNEMQANDRTLDRKRQSRATLQREVRAEAMSLDERTRARQAEQDRLDDAVKVARARLEQRDVELRARDQAARAAKDELKPEEIDALRKRLKNAEEDVSRAKLSRTDDWAVYGDGAAAVHAALKRALGDRCIGPLGMVVKVRDPKWALAIEVCMNKDTSAYCVPDHDTLKQATEIVRGLKKAFRPTFIVQKATASHQVSAEARQKPNTIFNQLTNDVPTIVVNTLIDVHDVDRVLLFDTEVQGDHEFFGGKHSATFRVAYIKNGTKQSITGAGVQSTGSYFGLAGARFIGADTANNINAAERALAAASSAYETAVAAVRQREATYRSAQTAAAAARTQHERAEVDAKRAAGAADQFRNSSVHEQHSKAEELNELEKELADREQRQRELEARVRHCDDAVATGRLPLEALEAQLNAAMERRREMQARLDQADADTAPANAAVADAQRKKQRAVASISAMDAEIAPKEQEMAAASARVAALDARVAAQLPGERPQVSLSTAQLESKLTALTNRCNRERGEHREPAVINAELAAAKKKYDETRKAVSDMVEWQKHMASGIGQRLVNLSCMKQQIGYRVDDQFNTMLAQQGHSGRVAFDHSNRTLEVSVKLANQDALAARSTATLSGGERMFSTVSLLLALWNCMEMPFRALDEFDVFMDAQNRGTSIHLLIQAARQDQLRQYIFISPHEVSSIPTSPDIRIVKMHNPDRNQRLLNFSQQQ